MCQYTRFCPVGRHRPSTKCPVFATTRGVGAVAVVAVVGLVWVGGPRAALDKINPPSPRAHQVGNAVVVDVVDGDTLVVRSAGKDVRVRLLGIDAPEVDHRGDGAGECYGNQATRQLETLTPVGSRVTLSADDGQDDLDKWGRQLRYVASGDTDVNRALLSQGGAKRFAEWNPLARADSYDQAAAGAARDRIGLWKACRS